MQTVTYHIGGYMPAAPAQNRAERYDSSAGTYTRWSPTGAQLEQRALTPVEVARFAAQDAEVARATNQATLTDKATAAIATNEAWINNTSPQVQTAMDALQVATWPAKPGASSTVAQVNAALNTIWDGVLVPLVTAVGQLSQAIETDNVAVTKALRDLNATMRLVAGALDSTSGT